MLVEAWILLFFSPFIALAVLDDSLKSISKAFQESRTFSPALHVTSYIRETLFWSCCLGLFFIVDVPAWNALAKLLGNSIQQQRQHQQRRFNNHQQDHQTDDGLDLTPQQILLRQHALTQQEEEHKKYVQYQRFILFVGVAHYVLMYPTILSSPTVTTTNNHSS
jgi:hypothetical protein